MKSLQNNQPLFDKAVVLRLTILYVAIGYAFLAFVFLISFVDPNKVVDVIKELLWPVLRLLSIY